MSLGMPLMFAMALTALLSSRAATGALAALIRGLIASKVDASLSARKVLTWSMIYK